MAMEARHPKETRFFCFVMRASTDLKARCNHLAMETRHPNRQGSLGLAQAWPPVLIKTWALEPTIFINCWVLSGLLVVRGLLSLAVGVVGGCCWPSLATTKPFAIVEAICHSMWATAETK